MYIPEIGEPLFLHGGQQVDRVVEGRHDEHDLREEDDPLPALVAVEEADGLNAVVRFDSATGKFCSREQAG
jgi:hypothetical protein